MTAEPKVSREGTAMTDTAPAQPGQQTAEQLLAAYRSMRTIRDFVEA